jgi:hypothetical protein
MLQFNNPDMNKSALFEIIRGFIWLMILNGSMPAIAQTSSEENTENATPLKGGVIRVLEPGVFDYQSSDYLVRMRAWGVSFPTRSNAGYKEAIRFSEDLLLDTNLSITVKKEFDLQNYKVVDIFLPSYSKSFSTLCIEQGVGWHNEKETNRHGVFVISQIKAKRQNLGVWKHGLPTEGQAQDNSIPTPVLKSMIGQNPFSGGIQFWVTSFNKIHRPGCSFYERGRGEYSRRPTGTDCRICGGVNAK